MKIRALFRHPRDYVCIDTIELPDPEPHQVRIRTAWSYLSAGTEIGMVKREMESAAPGDTERSNGRLGYSLSGTIDAVGSEVKDLKPGDTVAAIGSGAHHADYVNVSHQSVVKLPNGVDLKEASCTAMLCFALEGLRKAKPDFGEQCLVLGAGLMGQVAARLLLCCGARVWIMDHDETRLQRAPAEANRLVFSDPGWRELAEQCRPHGVESVYVCHGGDATPTIPRLMPVMSRTPDGVVQGKVVFTGGAQVTLTMASASGNLQFFSSAKAGPLYRDPAFESGEQDPSGYVKWNYRRNIESLLHSLLERRLDLTGLLTHEFAFEDAPEAYRMMAGPKPEALAVVFRYGNS